MVKVAHLIVREILHTRELLMKLLMRSRVENLRKVLDNKEALLQLQWVAQEDPIEE
jgi:hypothetical protein